MNHANQDSFSSVGRTALGLLVLGFSSALFGAMVVGPRLGGQLTSAPSFNVPAQSATTPLPPISRGPETRVAATTEPQPEPDAKSVAPATPEPTPSPADTEPSLDIPGAPEPAPTVTPVATSPASTPAERPTPAEAPESGTSTPVVAGRTGGSTALSVKRPEESRTVQALPGDASSPREEPRRVRSTTKEPEKSETRVSRTPAAREREADRKPAVEEKPKSRTTTPLESPREKAPVVARAATPTEPVAKGEDTADKGVFRVRVGRFKSREDAQKMRDELSKEGSQSFLVRDGDNYRLQIGVFSRKANAEKALTALKSRNLETEIASPEE